MRQAGKQKCAPVVVEAVGVQPVVVEALRVQPVGVEALHVQPVDFEALRMQPVVEALRVQPVQSAVLRHVELESPLLLRCPTRFLPPQSRNVDV